MCVASCKVGHVSGTQPPARRLPDLGAVDGVSSHLGEVLAANLHRVCPVPNQHPSGNAGGQDAGGSVRFSKMRWLEQVN